MDLEKLKAERVNLKEHLRELEAKQRKLENEIKKLRQDELKAKREIEALSTLIELGEARQEKGTPEPEEATP